MIFAFLLLMSLAAIAAGVFYLIRRPRQRGEQLSPTRWLMNFLPAAGVLGPIYTVAGVLAPWS